MSGLRRLLSLFVAAVVVDVIVFAVCGVYFGWRWTLLPASATGLLGLAVGLYCVWRYGGAVAASLDNDDRVDDHLLAGLLLLPAAFLLLLPGFATDIAGLLLLVPAVRRRVVRALRSRHSDVPSVLKIGEGRMQPMEEPRSHWHKMAA
jgi:UPF0716 protein FxsA